MIVLDANTGITAEPKNFGRAFNVTHTNVDYYPNATVASVEMAGPNGNKVVTLKAAATLTNPNPDIVPTEYGASADSFEAAVVNLIPPQRAGSLLFEIATANSLSGAFDATGRWASIDELSYEWKAAPGVHIVGDSIASAQPKAGHIGNQEAKVCADAILRLETGLQPYPAPVTNSACFTPITATTATWLTAIFGYDPNTGKMAALPPGIMEAAAPSTEAYESMSEWFSELMADTFR